MSFKVLQMYVKIPKVSTTSKPYIQVKNFIRNRDSANVSSFIKFELSILQTISLNDFQ